MRDLCSDRPDTDPRWWLTLVEQLPDTSALSAEVAFTAPKADDEAVQPPTARAFRGWGHERYLLAALYDALNANTALTGQWKRQPPKFPKWPRPVGVAPVRVERITETAPSNWPPKGAHQ